MPLNPTEEHHLKRQLLRNQLQKEFDLLNDRDALRKFGHPFTDKDPKLQGKRNEVASDNLRDENLLNVKLGATDFPMLSFFLQKFVMTFPLFSRNLAVDHRFWQGKVQVFFEHFMSMGFSDSYDREESTRRKRIGRKISKVILLLFNSGVGTLSEVEYYSEDKFVLQKENARKRSNIEAFTLPTRENLKNLITTETMFINNWDINIVAVVEAKVFKDKTASASPTHSRSPEPVNPPKNKVVGGWFKDPISTSTASMFSKLSMTTSSYFKTDTKMHKNVKKRSHLFILKIKSESNPTQEVYLKKTYDDFKLLRSNLKKEFPGKRIPHIPHKSKKTTSYLDNSEKYADTNIEDKSSVRSERSATKEFPTIVQQSAIKGSSKSTEIAAKGDGEDDADDVDEADDADDEEDGEEEEDETDACSSSFSETISVSDSRVNRLPHERLRTSLRQYLRTLCKDKEVANARSLMSFFKIGVIASSSFPVDVTSDIARRRQMDIVNLENQIMFQRIMLQKTLKLQDSMKGFKSSLLKDDHFLQDLFNEIRTKEKISDLSPLLRDFIDWCKSYLSSVIYQMFLGNDSSYEFYYQIRRLHKLVPYAVMGQIVKYTNPLAIMKAMVDLFMAQPFGSSSLLQNMFSTILSDDIKSQKTAIKALEAETSKDSKNSSEIIKCLKNWVFANENAEYGDILELHNEAESFKVPLVVMMLMKSAARGDIRDHVMSEVVDSYSVWKARERSATGAKDLEYNKQAEYFVHVKELLSLYIKERDKRLMRKLWQDPELSQLIKAIISLIYDPMVKIFKVARMDIAIKNLEKFMTDLVTLIDGIISGDLNSFTKFSVVESINQLVTKHQDSFYAFLHDIYIHDSEGIFEGFIIWFQDVIKFLQTSKYADTSDRINLNEYLDRYKAEINLEQLTKDIDGIIEQKLAARKIYKKLLDLKADDKASHSSTILSNNLKGMHSMVLPTTSESFGLKDTELVDLDIETGDLGTLKDRASESLVTATEEKLEEEYRALLDTPVESLEIQKFGDLIFQEALTMALARTASQ